jgi:hypothetical protein
MPSVLEDVCIKLLTAAEKDPALARLVRATCVTRYARFHTAAMNVWLHKQIMAKLAANGGKLRFAGRAQAAPSRRVGPEDWIARVKCIATSGVWLPFAAIKIKDAKSSRPTIRMARGASVIDDAGDQFTDD